MSKGDILIGRGQKENDIILPGEDLAISRVHCRIIYQDGFKEKKRLMPKAFMEFFKVFSDKHLEWNPRALYFPIEIRMRQVFLYGRQAHNRLIMIRLMTNVRNMSVSVKNKNRFVH